MPWVFINVKEAFLFVCLFTEMPGAPFYIEAHIDVWGWACEVEAEFVLRFFS